MRLVYITRYAAPALNSDLVYLAQLAGLLVTLLPRGLHRGEAQSQAIHIPHQELALLLADYYQEVHLVVQSFPDCISIFHSYKKP